MTGLTNWGATDAEVKRALPGDDLVPSPRVETTRAITIQAAAAQVWPWLVQIGYQRAGWYSYDAIHRLLQCAGSVEDPRHSANRVIPELQDLQVGARIHIAAPIGYAVVAIEPGRALVLHSRVDTRTGEPWDPSGPLPAKYLNASWTWYLDPVAENETRLIVRFRQDYDRSLLNEVLYGFVTKLGGFLMERKTLLGLKQRAETV